MFRDELQSETNQSPKTNSINLNSKKKSNLTKLNPKSKSIKIKRI